MHLRITKRLRPIRNQRRYRVRAEKASNSHDLLDEALAGVGKADWFPVVDSVLSTLTQIKPTSDRIVIEIDFTIQTI